MKWKHKKKSNSIIIKCINKNQLKSGGKMQLYREGTNGLLARKKIKEASELDINYSFIE